MSGDFCTLRDIELILGNGFLWADGVILESLAPNKMQAPSEAASCSWVTYKCACQGI